MDLSLPESGQGSGLAVAAEHWMDDPTEGAREEDQPRAGLISMQLRGMEFWATVGWAVMQQRWATMRFVPNDFTPLSFLSVNSICLL